jgi:hypothetical protein
MSLSTAAAIKSHLETNVNDWKVGATGIPFYRDKAPAGAVLPYGVIFEAIGKTPTQRGDNGINGILRELAQVDIYQAWRNPDNTIAEIPNLADRICQSLTGARLVTAPTVVYGCSIFAGPNRVTDDDNNLVRNTITVNVDRRIR